MKNVTEKELGQLLLEVQTVAGMPMFASVLQETKPKVTVKDRITGDKNPYSSITKRSYVSILLNSDYNKAVANQLTKEGKELDEHEKGKNTMPLVFGVNNQFVGLYGGDFVLQYRPNDNVKPKTTYFADGVEIQKSKVANFLPLDRPATNQGTEREIFWRKLYLKNVIELTFNGETYRLIK